MNRENDRERYRNGQPIEEGRRIRAYKSPPPGRYRTPQGHRTPSSKNYPLINKTFRPSRIARRPPDTEGLERPLRPPRRRYTDPPVRRRQRSHWPLFLGCFGFILLVALAIAVFVLRSIPLPSIPLPVPSLKGGAGGVVISTYTDSAQQSIPITNLTQLQVQNQVGNISVQVDPNPDATAITLTSLKKVKASSTNAAKQEFANIPLTVQPQGSSVMVSATVPAQSGTVFNSDASVDLTLSLPSKAIVQQPQAALTLNVHTTVGNVVVSGIKGVLTLKADKGDVTARQVTLVDGSHLEAGIGSVTFGGDLDTTDSSNSNSSPNYKISSETGNLEVTLPSSTNVLLDANTNVGKITTDFGLNISTNNGSASYYGPLISSTPPPSATLVLDVSTGNIDLHKG